MLSLRLATVVEITRRRPGLEEVVVEEDGRRAPARSYPQFAGPLEVGARVVINTTAGELELGTGGYHFVVGRLDGPAALSPAEGHIIKLRYTPLQFRVLAVEEEASPHREAIRECRDLGGRPVLLAPLHSLLAPAAAALKALTDNAARVAAVITDSAALPLALSDLAAALRERGLLDAAITTGQAFGGDFEAVNLFSGLLAARAVGQADFIIVAPGPGHVGTGTDYGFGGIEQGEAVNAVSVLGGQPVAIPRISFADPRPRHRGLSRQTAVALGQVALRPAVVAIPAMAPERAALVQQQLDESGISSRHRVVIRDGAIGVEALTRCDLDVASMGRSPDQDPERFWAAGAAAVIAKEETWTTPG